MTPITHTHPVLLVSPVYRSSTDYKGEVLWSNSNSNSSVKIANNATTSNTISKPNPIQRHMSCCASLENSRLNTSDFESPLYNANTSSTINYSTFRTRSDSGSSFAPPHRTRTDSNASYQSMTNSASKANTNSKSFAGMRHDIYGAATTKPREKISSAKRVVVVEAKVVSKFDDMSITTPANSTRKNCELFADFSDKNSYTASKMRVHEASSALAMTCPSKKSGAHGVGYLLEGA